MKYFTPEIAWHNRDPVLSVDIQATPFKDSVYRLASCGSDSLVVIWHIQAEDCDERDANIKANAVAELSRHERTVNAVRFSPNSKYLASADDDWIVIIWEMKLDEAGKESWNTLKTLRTHLNNVYDIAWSPDSNKLISASVDNTAIVWNVQSGKRIAVLQDHAKFVQGVAWDPLDKFVATLSTDRTCRLFCASTFKLSAQCRKAIIPNIAQPCKIFVDDTAKYFFRRLDFSPDGALLVAPAAIIDSKVNATVVFARSQYNQPCMYLPCGDQCSVAVRFCPTLFAYRNKEEKPLFDLPYRMVFAVATAKGILLYDTQQVAPFAYITDMHYATLNDVAWSSDGRLLVACSTDGFCTFLTFSEGELGELYTDKNDERTGDFPMTNDTESICEELPLANANESTDDHPMSNGISITCDLPMADSGKSNGDLPMSNDTKSICEELPLANANESTDDHPMSNGISSTCDLPMADSGKSNCDLPISNDTKSICEELPLVNAKVSTDDHPMSNGISSACDLPVTEASENSYDLPTPIDTSSNCEELPLVNASGNTEERPISVTCDLPEANSRKNNCDLPTTNGNISTCEEMPLVNASGSTEDLPTSITCDHLEANLHKNNCDLPLPNGNKSTCVELPSTSNL